MNILVVGEQTLFEEGVISILKKNNLDIDIKMIDSVLQIKLIVPIYKPNMIIINFNNDINEIINILIYYKRMDIKTKFVILVSRITKNDLNILINMDIDGVIFKNIMSQDFLYAINSVLRGKKYVDTDIYMRLNNTKLNALTKRESEVLYEIQKGLSNNQISKELFISECTVKKHIGNILSKLNLNNRTEAALYAKNKNNLIS